MTKPQPTEFRAKIIDDSGVIRGHTPAPLVKAMKGRPGDDMVFHSDERGRVTARISRHKTGVKKASRRTRKASA